MAYFGKYIDRNPSMQTAGICTKTSGVVGDSFKSYFEEEAAEDIIKTKCKVQEKLQRNDLLPRCPALPEDSIQDILSTELKKSRFVAFREKFSEDMYFKKPELGQVYPLHTKPEEITNESTIFGDKIHQSESLYDLILPNKTPDEVNREYVKWHDKYVLSHKHYFPSEQICRHYDIKHFNPTATFGINHNADLTGVYVRRILKPCDHIIIISKAQKQFLERNMGRLGQRLPRFDYNMPEDITFGLSSRVDKCNVKALIEDIDPCVIQTELIDAISHVNKLRRTLFQRSDFHMYDLKSVLEKADIEKTGYLPLSVIFEIARTQLIHINEAKFKIALKYFNLIGDDGMQTDRVNYVQVWKLLHNQYKLPKRGNISTIPKNMYHKETTYRNLCKDLQNNSNIPNVVIRKLNKTDEDRTTTKDVVAPGIPMHFGLGATDFETPRSKKVLRRIFKNIVVDEKFDEIWLRIKTKLEPKDDLISVDTFREVLNDVRYHSTNDSVNYH